MKNTNWRNDPPTEKQMMYIRIIEGIIPEKFKGTTKGEACDYISAFKEIDREMNEWAEFYGEVQAIMNEDAGDRI